VRVDAAPDCSFGGDLHRVGCRLQAGEAKLVEVLRPGGLIGKGALGLRRQAGDQGGRQSMGAHVIECCRVEHEVGMAGTQQIEKVQPALRWPGAKPREPVIADLGAETVHQFVSCAGVVDRYPGRCL
jgi:hypothetical protein